MIEYRDEVPENIANMLDKMSATHRMDKLTQEEKNIFIPARDKWWQQKFNISVSQWVEMEIKRKKTLKPQNKIKKDKIQKKLEGFSLVKKQKMEELHMALRNLDSGEPVNEFRDETRRVLYFDENKNQYFVEEAGQKKYLGIGDILSDYAWGIKYVPDGEMTEPAYRIVAKRILTNEARRTIENVHNEELARIHPEKTLTTPSKKTLLELWSESGKIEPLIGLMAEVIVRELMSRTCLNNNLSYVILRANSLEDSFYKYDFKIRASNKNRGVDIESSEPKVRKPTKIGFQLKTHLRSTGTFINIKEFSKGKKGEVDEVLLLTITTDEFSKSVKKWVETGKLSGGPEQFLSRDLKMGILKAVTKNLIEISEEEIEKIFPKEEVQTAN